MFTTLRNATTTSCISTTECYRAITFFYPTSLWFLSVFLLLNVVFQIYCSFILSNQVIVYITELCFILLDSHGVYHGVGVILCTICDFFIIGNCKLYNSTLNILQSTSL